VIAVKGRMIELVSPWAEARRHILLALLVGAVAVSLSACMADWLGASPAATLVVGKPTFAAGRGEVLIYVAAMPRGGLAAIAIDNLGLSFRDIVPASIEAIGVNGFTVLAQDFSTTLGKGRLVAVNPSCGIAGGTVVQITFEACGEAPLLVIRPEDKARVVLGSGQNTRIDSWALGTEKSYYAK